MKLNSKVVSTNDSGDGPKTNESQAKSSDIKKLVTKEKSSDALTAMRSDLQINRIFYLLGWLKSNERFSQKNLFIIYF